jgi:enamine deaminase RidA (YjgF/YER057c/UK114 family)
MRSLLHGDAIIGQNRAFEKKADSNKLFRFEQQPLAPGGASRGFVFEKGRMMERKNLFPERLSKRVVGGHVLYSPVVTVVAGKLVFVSGLLARNQNGEIVGKGDMGVQIRQVGENLKAALAAAGATLADLVRTQTFTTDIEEFFKHVDVRMEYLGPALPTSTTVEV